MKFSILHVNVTEKENYLHVKNDRKLNFELFTCQDDEELIYLHAKNDRKVNFQLFTCQHDKKSNYLHANMTEY